MSKFPENSQHNQQNSQNSSQTQTNSLVDQELSWNAILANIVTPLIPVFMAKLTGQKFPAPVNNAPNDQSAIQQITPVLQNMINTQNLLLQEVILLKKNDQVFANKFQGLKLTREKQQIEYKTDNQNSNDYE